MLKTAVQLNIFLENDFFVFFFRILSWKYIYIFFYNVKVWLFISLLKDWMHKCINFFQKIGMVLYSFKGVIGCPFSTSRYDSLGSEWKVYNILWLKFLNGRVKHLFYPVKISSVFNKQF